MKQQNEERCFKFHFQSKLGCVCVCVKLTQAGWDSLNCRSRGRGCSILVEHYFLLLL